MKIYSNNYRSLCLILGILMALSFVATSIKTKSRQPGGICQKSVRTGFCNINFYQESEANKRRMYEEQYLGQLRVYRATCALDCYMENSPQVVIGLVGFDLETNSDAGVIVEYDGLNNNDKREFYVKITKPIYSRVYGVYMRYIYHNLASDIKTVDVKITDFWNSQEQDFKTGINERKFYKTIDVPSGIPHGNYDAIAFFSGVQNRGKHNFRLRTKIEDKNSDNVRFYVRTWSDTKIWDFTVTLLFVKARSIHDGNTIQLADSSHLFSLKKGPLAGQFRGIKVDYDDIGIGSSQEAFYSLNYIDFYDKYNYRLKQRLVECTRNCLPGAHYYAVFEAWSTTRIYRVGNSVLKIKSDGSLY